MGTATRLRPGKTRLLEREISRSGKSHVVDRAAGVIKGVKVLGRRSENGREYTPECLNKAVRMYEGVSVRINHPDDPDEMRASEDVFGQLRNVRLADDGMYADLHYLKSHPMARRVCEAAERMPRLFGLSHNAQGDGDENARGVFVVREIVEVRSVDVVADPATTRGLFEGRRPVKRVSIAKFMRRAGRFLESARRKKLKEFLLEAEGDALDPSAEMDAVAMPAEPGPGDAESALDGAFKAAIKAVVDDDSLDMAAKLARMKELMKAHESVLAPEAEVAAETEEVAEGEEEDDEDKKELMEEDDEEEGDEEEEEFMEAKEECKEGCDGDGKKDKAMTEAKELASLRDKVRLYESRDRASRLCDTFKVKADAVLMESLLACKDETQMRRLLKREADLGRTNRTKPAGKGRSVTEGRETVPADDGTVDGFVRSLTAAV